MRETAREHYRRMAVESATPAGLVGMLYEGVVTCLRLAMEAAQRNDIPRRVEHANRALDIIAYLRATLDGERGGQVAATLRQFYAVAATRIFDAGVKNSPAMFAELETQFAGLREAWRAVERDEARGPAAAGAPTAPSRFAPTSVAAGVPAWRA